MMDETGPVALANLYQYAALGHDRPAQTVARMLLNLLGVNAYRFELSDLMYLDAVRHAECLAVLAWLRKTGLALRQHLGSTAELTIGCLARGLSDEARDSAWPLPGEVAHARMIGVESTPGLRNVVLQISLQGASGRAPSVTAGLHLSAQESGALTQALIAAHADAWRRAYGPIDRRPGETRRIGGRVGRAIPPQTGTRKLERRPLMHSGSLLPGGKFASVAFHSVWNLSGGWRE
jgi:hypothetical protein